MRLSTLRQPLGIRSDKLSEFARMGYVPGAVRCNPFGVPGPSTQFGTWYIDPKTGYYTDPATGLTIDPKTQQIVRTR